MNEQAIALREQIGIISAQEPKEVVERATKQAEALMDIVEKKQLYKQIGPKKHLYVEAWQTIARFNGCLVDIAWSRPIVENGAIVGYEARAELVRLADAMRLVGAEAECRFDEENWDDRDAYAVRSMAQTRAQSKVGRMAYAWVAVLAGYAGTPAEEMTKDYHAREPNEEGPRVPFGRDKGKLVTELTNAKDVSWLADAIKESIDDPKKIRYKAANTRLHAALTARLAELTAPAAPPTPDKEAPVVPPTPGAAGASPPPKDWRKQFTDACEKIGTQSQFIAALGQHGYTTPNEVPDYETAKKVYKTLSEGVDRKPAEAAKGQGKLV